MFTSIMSNATCPNCGATQLAGARFCRQCGRLVSSANAPGVTEATTRTLRTPAEFGSQPTDFFTPQPTSPAYLAPDQTPPPLAYATSNLEQGAQKRKRWVIGLMATLFLLSILAFGIISFVKYRLAIQPPPAAAPELPQGAVTEPHSPPPPPAPPATTTGPNSISRALVYPGAKIVMEMKRGDSGSLLQLQTNASFAKVLEWYQQKLKPSKIIKTDDPSAVLQSDKLQAIINSEDGETNIVLQELEQDEMEETR